ncbi:MAG: hypothetical protein H6505_02630 [Calditrichaeota bacterium]|nr:hypothetical protein [Calditrichota bacterium]
MINRSLLLIVLLLAAGCARTDRSEIIAEAGERKLTRAEFQYWAGKEFDRSSEAERMEAVSQWIEISMLEQEAKARGLLEDTETQQQARKMLANYYRAVLLAKEPHPEITDSLITEYYRAHQSEFKRPSDSYLIEGFWCESSDSLKAFRRALERTDTSGMRSGLVIWEGKWLTNKSELEPDIYAALREIAPGGLTQVLPVGDGFRLIRLHEVYPEGTQLGLDAVRQEIREQLLVEQSQRRQERWLTDLRGRYQPRFIQLDQAK